MVGKLRLNSNSRWEIVDDLDNCIELTSGEVIDVKIADQWIRTRIETKGRQDPPYEAEYYATTSGVNLCSGLTARTLD